MQLAAIDRAHKTTAIEPWDLAPTPMELIATLKSQSGRFSGLRFSPDSTRLVSGSDGKAITLWNLSTIDSGLNHSLECTLTNNRFLAFSPDCRLLASNPAGEFEVELWDTVTCNRRTIIEASGPLFHLPV